MAEKVKKLIDEDLEVSKIIRLEVFFGGFRKENSEQYVFFRYEIKFRAVINTFY